MFVFVTPFVFVLFPFNLTRPLAYVVSNSPSLDLRSEGPSNQLVALRQR